MTSPNIVVGVIILMVLAILSSLFMGLYHLLNNSERGGSVKTARALTYRIVLSLSLFGLLVLFYFNGLITPHGIWG